MSMLVNPFGVAPATGGGHRYWRLAITDNVAGAGTLTIDEVELLETFGGGNVAPLATVTASVTGSATNTIDKIVDGFMSGGSVSTPSGASNAYSIGATTVNIDFDFGLSYSPDIKIHRICAGSNDAGATTAPKTWTLQYSDNGSSWTTDSTVASSTGWGNYEMRTFYRTGYSPSYTGSPWGTLDEYRFVLLGTNQTSVFAGAEAEVRSTVGGASQLTGGTPSAVTSFAGLPIANLFDGNTGTDWATASFPGGSVVRSSWVKYVLAAAVAVAQIRWLARAAAGTQSPNTIILQGKRTAGQWTSLIWWHDATAWTNGESRTFTDPLFI